MQYEPSRLLSYSDSAGDLVRTNSIAAIGDHPNYHQPLVQSDWRVLKNRSNLGRELAFCMSAFALPLALIVQESNVFATASRAGHDAITPEKLAHVGQRVIRIAEIDHRILQSLWLVSVTFHAVNIGTSV
jgi:hypothetical protein